MHENINRTKCDKKQNDNNNTHAIEMVEMNTTDGNLHWLEEYD